MKEVSALNFVFLKKFTIRSVTPMIHDRKMTNWEHAFSSDFGEGF